MNGVARNVMIGVAGLAAFVLGCGSGAKQSAVATAPAPAATQEAAPMFAAGPSTLDSVYSTDQASRGKDVYMGTCRSCHAAAFFTDKNFQNHWKGKQLSDLYTYVLKKMPNNDPGSMSPDDVADVLAYVLQLNRMPAGSYDLWPEADSLKRYRIDTKK